MFLPVVVLVSHSPVWCVEIVYLIVEYDVAHRFGEFSADGEQLERFFTCEGWAPLPGRPIVNGVRVIQIL